MELLKIFHHNFFGKISDNVSKFINFYNLFWEFKIAYKKIIFMKMHKFISNYINVTQQSFSIIVVK